MGQIPAWSIPSAERGETEKDLEKERRHSTSHPHSLPFHVAFRFRMEGGVVVRIIIMIVERKQIFFESHMEAEKWNLL